MIMAVMMIMLIMMIPVILILMVRIPRIAVDSAFLNVLPYVMLFAAHIADTQCDYHPQN